MHPVPPGAPVESSHDVKRPSADGSAWGMDNRMEVRMPGPEYCSTEGCDRLVQIRKAGLCYRCYNAEWKRLHPEAALAHQRKWQAGPKYAAHRKAYAARVCETCEREYQPVRKDQRYCTPKCLNEHKRQTDQARWLAMSPEQKRAKYDRDRATNIMSCRAWKKRRRLRVLAARLAVWAPVPTPLALPPGPPAVALCRRCSTPFLPRHGSRYCTPKCIRLTTNERADARQSKARAATRVWTAGYCREDGKPFVVVRAQTAFCSPACAKRNRRRKDKDRRSKRIKEGVRTEVIDLAVLAKRDGWRCHICKRKVTRRTWSTDHLVPLDDGGSHTWDNVALAHFMCNSIRGAHGAAQLLLIG